MDTARQEAFQKLRPPCVELSSVALKFRARQEAPKVVQNALEYLHHTLKEVGHQNGLDEKLAEYVFFPLTHIFNETQRLPASCLEVAARCLQILVEKGWRTNLSPAMGKQLIILMTILAGGHPGGAQGQESSKPRSEELVVAGFDCLSAIFLVLDSPEASKTIYNEIGTATVVDQTVYVLLEGITDGSSDEIRLSSVTALSGLYSHVTSRTILASLLPRTVSGLTKTLRPTTQLRRSYKLLQKCLQLLADVLRAVLNDRDAFASYDERKNAKVTGAKDELVLDESWLKATSSQVRLALANVIQLRSHDRVEVREALLQLCLMVIEECSKSLADSLTIAVETTVALSKVDDQGKGNSAYRALSHLVTSDNAVTDILKSSLHTWIVALPRVMQANDDSAKQRAIRQISTAFSIISLTQPPSGILDDTLTSSLCESVTAAIHLPSNTMQPVASADTKLDLDLLQGSVGYTSFQPVVLGHRSQAQSLQELRYMISLNNSESSLAITRSLLDRLHGASGNSLIAPLWLSLRFLDNSGETISFDNVLSGYEVSSPPSTRSSLIEELYSIALPILTDASSIDAPDWRLQALALEVVALEAQQLGEAFQPELIDALYPVLQFLGSANPSLRHHAMTCLNILTRACNYKDTSNMLIENMDYLVNSVGLKLNTFDVSPQAPQVLLMMVRLCGGKLVPYLDDLVGSIFAILDSFHGYPKLVELLFATLGAIVDEGARQPETLAIIDGNGQKQPVSKQRLNTPNVADVAKMFAERKERTNHPPISEEAEGLKSHPKRPWTSTLDGLEKPKQEDTEDIEAGLEKEPEEPLPPTQNQEESNALSKPHSLLLHIAESIPPHLSSPSPYLRRTLLSILARALPILAHNENSFLPLINNIWHAVSARITLPPSLASGSVSLTIAATPNAENPPTSSNMGETGVKEETFVIVAACEVLEEMCKGAGDFMTSRLEHEFPRLKQIYIRVWDKVHSDAERIIARRKHRYQGQQQGRLIATVPEKSKGHAQNTEDQEATSILPSELNRIFTSHHATWKALTSLFTTMLAYVRLPPEVADEICSFTATWIATLFPTQLHAYNRNTKRKPTAPIADGVDPEISKAIRAMEVWNPDLTWFVFERELVCRNPQKRRRRIRTPRVPEEVLARVKERVGDYEEERWSFADMVF